MCCGKFLNITDRCVMLTCGSVSSASCMSGTVVLWHTWRRSVCASDLERISNTQFS
jgi:hypothetical protein